MRPAHPSPRPLAGAPRSPLFGKEGWRAATGWFGQERNAGAAALRQAMQIARPVPAHYRLAIATSTQHALARAWLTLGLAALALSGVFSVLLVLSRTPGLQGMFPVADFFRVALVVHVDLSVLVWFLAFAGIFWSMSGTRRAPALGWAALALCAAGTAAMSAAPFLGGGAPIMANYIPVLDGPLFLAGLVVVGAGTALMVVRALFTAPPVGHRLDGGGALRLGLVAAAFATAIALFAFVWSWRALPASLDSRTYYEVLFWGGGHVLQFTWTLLMLMAWLWLADAIGARLPLSPRVVVFLFGLSLALVLLTPFVYLMWDVSSVEHRRVLTWMMRVGGGLAIPPLALALVLALARLRNLPQPARPLRAALVMSLALFAAGGLIGFVINGANVKIPAHYHGCIVGITLAFMGVAYELLPRLGYRAPVSRLAVCQPYVYGVGQLMHIAGLVWSGGYGVQRKVAGAEQVLTNLQQVAGMGLMGLGGLVAIVGGLLFLVVMIGAMRGGRGNHGLRR
jgi:cytochrome c oxidase subunit 1